MYNTLHRVAIYMHVIPVYTYVHCVHMGLIVHVCMCVYAHVAAIRAVPHGYMFGQTSCICMHSEMHPVCILNAENSAELSYCKIH